MDYLRGWKALQQDPQWIGKVVIGSVILLTGMCIPVVGQIVLIGWLSLALRRAVCGQDAPLPRLEFDVDYLIKLLKSGFKPFLAQILWSLPMFGVVVVTWCCMSGVSFAVFGALSSGGGGGEAIGLVSLLVTLVGYLVMFVGMFFGGMLLQIGVTRAEIADDLGPALQFKETVNMTKMLFKELFIGSLVLGMVGFVGMLIAAFTLYLGLLPVVMILMTITTFYRAELYRVYLEKGGQPIPVGTLAIEGGDAPLVQAPGQTAAPGPHQGGGGWGPPPVQF